MFSENLIAMKSLLANSNEIQYNTAALDASMVLPFSLHAQQSND